MVIYAVDIGSIKEENFGWCRIEGDSIRCNTDINKLVDTLVCDLTTSKKVTLGFECPVTISIRKDEKLLTAQRDGENGRPWSAGAGASALATGMSEIAWIFEYLKDSECKIKATTDWSRFNKEEFDLFLWEAFISSPNGKPKSRPNKESHMEDARVAAQTFLKSMKNLEECNAVKTENTYSIISSLLLWSGLSEDIKILHQPCIVIKADKLI